MNDCNNDFRIIQKLLFLQLSGSVVGGPGPEMDAADVATVVRHQSESSSTRQLESESQNVGAGAAENGKVIMCDLIRIRGNL